MHEIFFFLLLVLLPTQLGYHLWPDWALVLGRRVDYLSPTLYVTDILIFFIILLWLFEIRKRKKTIKFYFPFFLFILFIPFNIYFAANRTVALFAWIKMSEFVALGWYIVETKPKLPDIIFPLSIGVLYSSLIAIIQFLLQHSIGGPLWFLGERTFTVNTPGIARVDFHYSLFTVHYSLFKLRSYATFPHPNVLGGYLAVLLPAILQYSNTPIIKLSNTKKIFFITTIFLGILTLALTFSRSAWIVFVFGISYLVFQKKKKLFFPILCFVILCIFVVGKTFGFQDESVVVRGQLNSAAVSMIAASPIIGNGLGNFLVRLPDYLVSRTIYFLQPVHNIYLLLLSETGIAGFLIFLWILWKAARNKISMSLCAILLLGFVDHYFFTLQQGQLLFTVFLSLSLVQ